ncbi:MAG: DUF4145 domain-containing protein [Geminicoccaceae bacterium]
MPEEIERDFCEAASIVELSPRGSAALARLCVEKLVTRLGAQGDNLNSRIQYLVDQGLPVRIQKALDTVRVIGNEAVHAGKIDLKDDKETAAAILHSINLIVEYMIVAPARIDRLYDSLPQDKLDGIAKRGKKSRID